MIFWCRFLPGVYILIGAGSLVMLVGFFGCCGAVRESQCLLGSVSASKYFSILFYYIFTPSIVLFCCCISAVFCVPADHCWCWGGSRGLWILEQRQGTFLSSPWHRSIVEWISVTSCLPNVSQIIEDVQNFYSSTYNESRNSTLIMSYQKIVSPFFETLYSSCRKWNVKTRLLFSVELLWNHSESLHWCPRYHGKLGVIKY